MIKKTDTCLSLLIFFPNFSKHFQEGESTDCLGRKFIIFFFLTRNKTTICSSIPTTRRIPQGYKNWKRQFSSVAQSCPTLCNALDCGTPGLPVHHQLPEFTQTHVHWVDDAIQPSHLLSSPSPPAFNLSQHQGLFQWVSVSHQVAKVL